MLCVCVVCSTTCSHLTRRSISLVQDRNSPVGPVQMVQERTGPDVTSYKSNEAVHLFVPDPKKYGEVLCEALELPGHGTLRDQSISLLNRHCGATEIITQRFFPRRSLKIQHQDGELWLMPDFGSVSGEVLNLKFSHCSLLQNPFENSYFPQAPSIAIDTIETTEGLIVLADVPSFLDEREEGVYVDVDDKERVLMIRIMRPLLFFREYSQELKPLATHIDYTYDRGEGPFNHIERSTRVFQRKMAIPDGFEATIASKTISNGQLQLLLPRTPVSSPRTPTLAAPLAFLALSHGV